MHILTAINENYNSFTKTQRRIADLIVENYAKLAFVTLEEMAKQIEVSTTSVIRFARALGFEGYTQLQEEIRRELMGKVSLPQRYEDSYKKIQKEDLLEEMLKAEIQGLKQTVEQISLEQLQAAVKAISSANRLYILGSRSTYGVAHYFSFYLSQVRDDVHFVSGVGNIHPEELVGAKKGDVCISYLFPRYQKILVTWLSYLKAKGVKIILFTNPFYDAVKHLSDIFLCCSVDGIMPKDSLLSVMFLSNYLVTAVMATDYLNTSRRFKEIEEALNKGFYLGL